MDANVYDHCPNCGGSRTVRLPDRIGTPGVCTAAFHAVVGWGECTDPQTYAEQHVNEARWTTAQHEADAIDDLRRQNHVTERYGYYPECPACGGQGAAMGTLGALDWWRCIQCGIQFHSKSYTKPAYAPKQCPECGTPNCPPVHADDERLRQCPTCRLRWIDAPPD